MKSAFLCFWLITFGAKRESLFTFLDLNEMHKSSCRSEVIKRVTGEKKRFLNFVTLPKIPKFNSRGDFFMKTGALIE